MRLLFLVAVIIFLPGIAFAQTDEIVNEIISSQEIVEDIIPSQRTVEDILPPKDFDPLSYESYQQYFGSLVKRVTGNATFVDLASFSLGMVIYGIFIFNFYKLLARKDILSLHLAERLSHGKATTKVAAFFAFIGTNFIIFPIIIVIWFIVYSLFLFFLAPGIEVKTVFLVSSSLVVAIRIAAYYNEDLSRDLAKLIPFAVLGIFLLNPTFFTIDELAERVRDFPVFLSTIFVFVFVAIVVETILSILYFIKVKITGSKKENSF